MHAEQLFRGSSAVRRRHASACRCARPALRARCRESARQARRARTHASRSTPCRAAARTRRDAPRRRRSAVMDQAQQRVRPAPVGRADWHVGALSEQRHREPPRVLVFRSENVRARSVQRQRLSAAAVRQARPRRARLQHPRRHDRLHRRGRHAVFRVDRPNGRLVELDGAPTATTASHVWTPRAKPNACPRPRSRRAVCGRRAPTSSARRQAAPDHDHGGSSSRGKGTESLPRSCLAALLRQRALATTQSDRHQWSLEIDAASTSRPTASFDRGPEGGLSKLRYASRKMMD